MEADRRGRAAPGGPPRLPSSNVLIPDIEPILLATDLIAQKSDTSEASVVVSNNRTQAHRTPSNTDEEPAASSYRDGNKTWEVLQTASRPGLSSRVTGARACLTGMAPIVGPCDRSPPFRAVVMRVEGSNRWTCRGF